MSANVLITAEAFLGDRMAALHQVTEALRHFFTHLEVSSIFEIDLATIRNYSVRGHTQSRKEWGTLAVAFAGQTSLGLDDFFENIINIESVLNSTFRCVDVDLIFYNEEIIMTPPLTLPHPEFHRRPFLLIPASEVVPDMRHPILEKTVRELTETFSNTDWGRYFARGNILLEAGISR